MEQHVPIAIVGTGFGGLGMAIRLKQSGIRDFVLFERAHDIGGTWRDNTYPGCAVDIESPLYSFSFEQNFFASRLFSPGREIWDYLKYCADRFEIRPHIRFGHEVKQITWDENQSLWRLVTSQGVFTADSVVTAVGALSEPSLPELPGLESFQGKTMHSARWDNDYDLAGKRVAVIGTGASAIQIVPAIQPQVEKLYIFQRTAPWVIPRLDRAFKGWERRLMRKLPFLQKLRRWRLYWFHESLGLGFRHPKMMEKLEAIALRHMKRAVKDPELRKKLTPSYRIGCKRIVLSNDYYPALAQSNVALVTEGIREVRERAIVAGDGKEYAADAIVLGTGFQVTSMPYARRIRGREGRLLSEVWGESPRAFLGTTVTGFPNLFVIMGPNTGLGHNSVVLMIEAQIAHALKAIRFMRKRKLVSIDPKLEALNRFNAEVDRKMQGTVWTSGGCRSWYLDTTGRNSALWPGSVGSFVRTVAPFRPSDYRLDPRPLTLEERMQRRALRLLCRLPARLQIKVSGKPPVRHGPDTLHPNFQILLAMLERERAPRFCDLPPQKCRAKLTRDSFVHSAGRISRVSVTNVVIPGAAGNLRARHYVPPTSSNGGPKAPLLVYFHGGGFVLGDLDCYDGPCRFLAQAASVQVLSVHYRLAPEHHFPAAVEDAEAAFAWALEHASELGADPARVAIGGDSAGGNLAAVISLARARAGLEPPTMQLLLYPAVDRVTAYESLSAFAEGFFLTRADIDWFYSLYSAREPAADPRLSPLLAKDLSGLPPAVVVTAAFDPLRDEGEAYAAKLSQAGVSCRLLRMPGMIHGFMNCIGWSPAAKRALGEVAAALRDVVFHSIDTV